MGKILEDLSTEDSSLWKMTQTLTKERKQRKIPPNKSQNSIITTIEDKTEVFAEAFQKQFTTNRIGSIDVDRKVNQFMEDFENNLIEEHEEPPLAAEEEVKKLLKQ